MSFDERKSRRAALLRETGVIEELPCRKLSVREVSGTVLEIGRLVATLLK